jgi:hypothetical protein
MIELLHTSSTHVDFQKLTLELEREIFLRDGELADVNYRLNKVGFMKNAIVLYLTRKRSRAEHSGIFPKTLLKLSACMYLHFIAEIILRRKFYPNWKA